MNLTVKTASLNIVKPIIDEVRNRAHSFKYAFYGIKLLFTSQPNAKIHAGAAIVAIGVGFLFGLSPIEWGLIVLTIAGVCCAEALNTAIELLCDATVPEVHPLIKQAKDLAAGAVLLSAIGAVIIAILVYGPHIAMFFKE